VKQRVPLDACPLCGGSHRPFATGEATACQHWREGWPELIHWVECTDCGHVFTSGVWSDEDEAELYASRADHEHVGSHRDAYRLAYARLVEQVQRFQPSGSWLDVGFGNGALLCTAAEYGFKPFGLERRRDQVTELALRAGVPAAVGDFLAYDHPSDVVSLCDVLEHVKDPVRWLQHARRISTGVLVISTPTCFSPFWRLMTEPNLYLAEVQHYHCFSRPVLDGLLRRCGFEPVAYHAHGRYLLGGDTIAVTR